VRELVKISLNIVKILLKLIYWMNIKENFVWN